MNPDVPLLEVRNLDAFYGDFRALSGASLSLARGEIAAIIGANGAGKSTLLGAIAGLVRQRTGSVKLNGEEISTLPANAVVAEGIALVPEGRRLFPSLTVEENLQIGGQLGRSGPWSLDRIYGLFPVLSDRRRQASTSLSGGEQQMVAIGRALMSNPAVLLCDEISLGLAPVIVRSIYASLPAIVEAGCALILVEQDTVQALAAASRIYCMREGRIVLSGSPAGLSRETIVKAYFGE